jgi:uncharacterized protein YigE (DUF2233 family)
MAERRLRTCASAGRGRPWNAKRLQTQAARPAIDLLRRERVEIGEQLVSESSANVRCSGFYWPVNACFVSEAGANSPYCFASCFSILFSRALIHGARMHNSRARADSGLLAFAGIVLGICAVGHDCARAATAASPCRPFVFEGSDYTICVLDLRTYELRLSWKDENGQPYGGFDRLPRSVNGIPIALAMNAGMYETDLSPVGLYVEHGKTLKRANTAKGPGNFHIQPNGVFYLSGQTAGVLTTQRFLTVHPKADFATQSGPMLVIDGKIHPRIRPGMTSRKIRNGVGVRDARTVVLAISDDPVTFWEFARLFREGLGTPDALFLDGSISSLYVPALHRDDALFPMGPIIVGFQRTEQ